MKPLLVFRVGVTGARDLSGADMPALRAHVAAILADVRRMVNDAAARPAAQDIYFRSGREPASIELRLVSPLAEGADRLLAEEALKLGYRLSAPFPFSRSDYATDFPDTIDAFDALAATADVFELDGARGEYETASYEAVGRFVVRNCDLLIALWAGKPAQGRGGTAEIVQFAVQAELPVWWLALTGDEGRLLYGRAQYRARETAPQGQAAATLLQGYIDRLVVPPLAVPPLPHGVIGRSVHALKRWHGDRQSPFETYIREPETLSAGGLWSAYALFMRLMLRNVKVLPDTAERVKPEPESPSDQWWQPYYDRADQLSIAYGERYRSSYVLIITFAFLTVVMSALGHVVLPPLLALVVEIMLILGAIVLVWLNHAHRWHERWIFYRLLAELCRKQMMLSPVGRILPAFELDILTADGNVSGDAAGSPRAAWVGWYLRAIQRGERHEGSIDEAKRHSLDIGRHLAETQIDYHRARRTRTEAADRRLATWIELFFVLTICSLILRLFGYVDLHESHFSESIEVIAALFSSASAALVGLRTYGEFSLLAQQSSLMQRLIMNAKVELEALDPTLPLSSQEIASTLQRLAVLMMQEVRGWAQLFSLKSIDSF